MDFLEINKCFMHNLALVYIFKITCQSSYIKMHQYIGISDWPKVTDHILEQCSLKETNFLHERPLLLFVLLNQNIIKKTYIPKSQNQTRFWFCFLWVTSLFFSFYRFFFLVLFLFIFSFINFFLIHLKGKHWV